MLVYILTYNLMIFLDEYRQNFNPKNYCYSQQHQKGIINILLYVCNTFIRWWIAKYLRNKIYGWIWYIYDQNDDTIVLVLQQQYLILAPLCCLLCDPSHTMLSDDSWQIKSLWRHRGWLTDFPKRNWQGCLYRCWSWVHYPSRRSGSGSIRTQSAVTVGGPRFFTSIPWGMLLRDPRPSLQQNVIYDQKGSRVLHSRANFA